MLVYSRADQVEKTNEIADIEPPDVILDHVVKDNHLFEDWADEVKVIMEMMIHDGRTKQEDIQRVYSLLKPSDCDESEWVATDWLKKWMSEKTSHVPPIDNSCLMCKHQRLDPCRIQLSKRISSKAGDILFKKYGGLPRLQENGAMCLKCVINRARRIQFDAHIEKHKKMIATASKTTYSGGDGFWVGKSSLKQWKQLAIDAQNFDASDVTLTESKGETSSSRNVVTDDGSDIVANGTENDEASSMDISETLPAAKKASKRNHESQFATEIDAEVTSSFPKQRKNEESLDNEANMKICEEGTNADEKPAGDTSTRDEKQSKANSFNQDIICADHGNLSQDENKRKLVSPEVWNCLKYYFKDCPVFGSKERSCSACKDQDAMKRERKEALRIFANDMKNSLMDLYLDVKRPLPDVQAPFEIFAVSKCALDDWRIFVRWARSPRFDLIENSDLICEHKKLLYSAMDLIKPRSQEEFTLLTAPEWKLLSGFLPFDTEIKITNEESHANSLQVSPECCDACRSIRLIEDNEADKEFFYSPIYVRKILGQGNEDFIDFDQMTIEPDTEEERAAKRKKLDPPALGSRKSSRHRTKRGEYMFRVDSSQTLKEIKVQIMPAFSVLPIDQHLSFEDGTPLEDDKKTLADLGIRPGCLLLLKVDEPNEKAPPMEDVTASGQRKLEEGFKGTGLCGAFSLETQP